LSERLNSWKAIAGYLGREVRTVQRWAKERDLPVHRLPGGARPRVFAFRSEIDAWLSAPPSNRRSPPATTIAVLPFPSLGGARADPAFGDGLADDLINELVRIPGLRVIARTSSFAAGASNQDVRTVGARIGADWLVEGSVRQNGHQLRVSAQLVNTSDGTHAWSERYDREVRDRLAIQDEIARAIARALNVTLRPERTAPTPPDPIAWELWVRGRGLSQQYTSDAAGAATACYEAAIAQDATFARPHFGLAELLLGTVRFGLADPLAVLPRAHAELELALQLDDQFGEAHALLGVCRGFAEFDWAGAGAAFQRALELSPGSASVLTQHAWYYLVPTLQLVRAVESAEEAVALDPLSPGTHGLPASTRIPAQALALASLGVGDDRVFEYLDLAISERDPMISHLPSMPMYDGLRADPRFAQLLRRLGLAPGVSQPG